MRHNLIYFQYIFALKKEIYATMMQYNESPTLGTKQMNWTMDVMYDHNHPQ